MNELEDGREGMADKGFEQELRRALERVDAPDGFAERVMARAVQGKPPAARVLTMRPGVGPARTKWLSGAIAAAALAAIAIGGQMHLRRQREAEAAERQFEAGVRITDQALERTREQLALAGVRFGE